ncbi:hypothetical protein KP13_32148 [Klebsiella pneumoniae subsp. pneumoniae Kp13]|nr:hypothetical protein KP13_32148 [Klebsiella pneumoniae subsp. pneumoniae Kp13]
MNLIFLVWIQLLLQKRESILMKYIINFTITFDPDSRLLKRLC